LSGEKEKKKPARKEKLMYTISMTKSEGGKADAPGERCEEKRASKREAEQRERKTRGSKDL